MSRARALKEPFWATSLSKMKTGPAGIVRGLYALVQRSPALKPYLWMGSGWRTGSVEHSSGRAIDIIVTARTGMRPNDSEHKAALELIYFLQRNARFLGIQHILYSPDRKNAVQSWSTARGAWKVLGNRGSISGNHVDHIHVYFTASAKWPSTLNTAIVGGGTAPKPSPGLPASGVDNSKEDLMAGITEEKLAEIVQAQTRAALIGVLENKDRYTEYVDEDGKGRNTRSLVDIIFSGHANAIGANRTVAALAAQSGLDEKQVVAGIVTGVSKLLGDSVKKQVQDALKDVSDAKAEDIARAVVSEIADVWKGK